MRVFDRLAEADWDAVSDRERVGHARAAVDERLGSRPLGATLYELPRGSGRGATTCEARDGRLLGRGRHARDAGRALQVASVALASLESIEHVVTDGVEDLTSALAAAGGGRGGGMSPRLATFLVFGVDGAMIGTWLAPDPAAR
jgi:hypothetical protein